MIEADRGRFGIISRQLKVEKEKSVFVWGLFSTFNHDRVEIL